MLDGSDASKASLRYLAAARFYLPMELKGADKFAVDEQYLDYLHNGEFKLALEELAEMGLENPGFAHERLFWREMELAAASLGLTDKAREYRQRGEG